MSIRNKNERIEQSISDSLEVDRKLLPHMPYLLQDMWSMGSSVDDILNVVSGLELPVDQSRILDLGCGKGAVSVQIAARYGYRVTGIDVMDAFLEAARKKTLEYRAGHLCQFLKKDILEYVSREHDYDMVILASLGGILGSVKTTITKLRAQLKTGGYILIDDGYLREGNSLDRKGYGHYCSHKETIRQLTAFGDLLIREVNTTEFSLALNEKYLEIITRRGEELAHEYPELRKDIKAYIDLQAEECDVIRDQIEGALWILQKK